MRDPRNDKSPDRICAARTTDPGKRIPRNESGSVSLKQVMEPPHPVRQQEIRTIVFTSPDGRAARWVAAEVRERWPDCHSEWLQGGTDAWRAAGLPTAKDWKPAQSLTPFEDDWGSVMRVQPEHRERAWTDYLVWERGLSARVVRDPTVRFRLL